MAAQSVSSSPEQHFPWWRSIGPALITACVVLGPGSLLVSSNVGAKYGYELLWLFVVTGVLMCSYVVMAMRIGVIGEATPCALLARHLDRSIAVITGINFFLIATTFQFGNNLAAVTAINSLGVTSLFGSPEQLCKQAKLLINCGVLLVINGVIIVFLFMTTRIYHALERLIKIMVAVMTVCFLVNLFVAHPDLGSIFKGFIPNLPAGLSLELPKKIDGVIYDPMILIASLFGTTFSVAAAFYQGNLVREKGWTIKDCKRGTGDSIFGIAVLTIISMIIMITAATVIPGQPAADIGVLAQSLRPLLGSTAHLIFCVGLMAVAVNPFLINAMIGGSMLADGLGKPAKLSDPWSLRFTTAVLLIGMIVAMLALKTGEKPVKLIIFGQALTVLGNPLMAAAILWLANQKDIMGDKRNKIFLNIFGAAGLAVVCVMAGRVFFRLIL